MIVEMPRTPGWDGELRKRLRRLVESGDLYLCEAIRVCSMYSERVAEQFARDMTKERIT